MSAFPQRCERNLAGPEEDCGFRIAYVPCREPAHWLVEGTHGRSGWYACEKHATEALLEEGEVTDDDGEPMTLDDGEIARAS